MIDPTDLTETTDTNEPVGPGNHDAAENAADLATIQRDLTAVEAALTALDDGSYWVDEVTGAPIPDEVLADNPVARRA